MEYTEVIVLLIHANIQITLPASVQDMG